MSRKPDTLPAAQPSFPRVSGDEPVPSRLMMYLILFSPRERG